MSFFINGFLYMFLIQTAEVSAMVILSNRKVSLRTILLANDRYYPLCPSASAVYQHCCLGDGRQYALS